MRDVKELSLKFGGKIKILETPCFFVVAFVCQNAFLCSSILVKQSSKKYKKQGVSTIKIFPPNFRLSSLTSRIHYQLQDGGFQLSSFGKDFVGLKRTLEAEIWVNNISLCKLFIGVKKINGHSGVNFSF